MNFLWWWHFQRNNSMSFVYLITHTMQSLGLCMRSLLCWFLLRACRSIYRGIFMRQLYFYFRISGKFECGLCFHTVTCFGTSPSLYWKKSANNMVSCIKEKEKKKNSRMIWINKHATSTTCSLNFIFLAISES